jgi:6,7-dimethyl-8-ribityllumazine synthase
MANVIPPRPRIHSGPQSRRLSISVVASQFNREFVDGLVLYFRREMEALAPGASIELVEVPGSFEIPLAVQEIASRQAADAIVAFGVILQGETMHAQFIGQSVTNALLDCAMRLRTPVVHEVLLVRDEAQARERCLEPMLNRGTEAARTAIRIAQVMAELKR